jgi:hypothetical protein
MHNRRRRRDGVMRVIVEDGVMRVIVEDGVMQDGSAPKIIKDGMMRRGEDGAMQEIINTKIHTDFDK